MLVKLAEWIKTYYFNYRDKSGFHQWNVKDIHAAPIVERGTADLDTFKIRKNLDPDRVEAADLSYPITLGSGMSHLVDGQHRVAKARQLGHKKIKFIVKDLSRIPEFHD